MPFSILALSDCDILPKNDLDVVIKNYDLGIQAYESVKTFSIVKRRYQGGLSSSFDFNQAQSDMNSAPFTMIKDKYDVIFKSKIIKFYMGQDINE